MYKMAENKTPNLTTTAIPQTYSHPRRDTTCPNCGYCPTCGRGNATYPASPVAPQNFPYTVTYQTTAGTCPTTIASGCVPSGVNFIDWSTVKDKELP